MTKFFVPVRDRLGCLVEVLNRLSELCQPKQDIVLVDMGSTYTPLLEHLRLWAEEGYSVVMRASNEGARGLFQRGIIKSLVGENESFFLSDPDVVPTPDCRGDLLAHMTRCLARYPEFDKIGLSLKIDDIPMHYPLREKVMKWESQFSAVPVNAHLYRAWVATTFCVIRSIKHVNALGDTGPALTARTRDAMARHTTWYLDPDDLPEDELHYYRNAPLRPWGAPVPGVSWGFEAKHLEKIKHGKPDGGETEGAVELPGASRSAPSDLHRDGDPARESDRGGGEGVPDSARDRDRPGAGGGGEAEVPERADPPWVEPGHSAEPGTET